MSNYYYENSGDKLQYIVIMPGKIYVLNKKVKNLEKLAYLFHEQFYIY